jgi:hypothetical protein
MKNLIITNQSGLFSSLLGFFFWVHILEKYDTNINLKFHTRNKSGSNEKKYYFGETVESIHFPNNLLKGKNIFLNIFKENEYLNKKDFPEEFTFTHLYPSDINEMDQYLSEPLRKYRGRGLYVQQYFDEESLKVIRESFYNGWKKFSPTDEISNIFKEEKKLLTDNTLCIMARTSLHYEGYGHNSQRIIDSLIEDVKVKMDNYDQILLTTQVKVFVDEFKKVFGDKCVIMNRPKRLDSDMDWVGVSQVMNDEDYIDEIKYCLLDVMLSSECKHIIGSSSNMFLGALSMNPNAEYSLVSDLMQFDGL